jgi:hypothetical protein
VSSYEFTISLRVRHPSITPDRVTDALGIQPQHTWKAGDARLGPTGEAIDGTYRESYWMARLMEEPQLSGDVVSVESIVLDVLSKLRRNTEFLTTLKVEGAHMELHISLYARENFRLELLSETLALLGRLGLDIGLDVQPHPPTASPPSILPATRQ